MTLLPDQADRDRAVGALEETVFVTAGAGAGKTRVLVDRICGLVTDPTQPVPMHAIAAVTFTEKAAAELRDRVRAELARRTQTADGPARQRIEVALAELDVAAIGTLHAFAARLLMENPIEAGLPPVITVLDEVASSVRDERWWATARTRLLEDRPTAEAVQVLLATGVRLEAIREVAIRLQADWDLAAERCAHAPAAAHPRLDLQPLRLTVADLQRRAAEECHNPADKLLAYITGPLHEWMDQVEQAADLPDRLAVLGTAPKPGNAGAKGNWDDVGSVKAQAKGIAELADAARDAVTSSALSLVVARLARLALDEVRARRAEGALQFQDLLVLARDMLRDGPTARAAAHRRYRRLLLDEFQDTDPLQIEIAVRIVAGDDGGQPRWQDCPVPPGSLFVVGDAKQSIYRFRRASIGTYLAARDALAGARPAVLSTNFRSHPAVLAWANTVFSRLIHAEPGGQPAYEHLDPDPDRVALHAGQPDPRVLVIGADPVGTGLRAAELREIEAGRVAATIAQLLRDAPPVEGRAAQAWTSRRLRASDVCVLVPARTSITELEAALDELNVPYRTEASSLVYRSDEVRDLLLAARAVDDPTDELALVEALRTPLFGCGDDDLVAWRAAGGRFGLFSPWPQDVDPDDPDGPVAESIAFLRRMSRQRSHLAPSELLDAIVRQRRALEVATDPGSSRYRETWRRLRFVVDQARAWSEVEHGSLRDFLDWAGRQATEEEKATEIVLPERDVEAIRILTIHAAKGLEFPVVVLSGMTSVPWNKPGALVWTASGPPQVRVGEACTDGWQDARDAEEHLLHLESIRLLYVAATRAESRLVVSLVRNGGGPSGERRSWTRAELLAEASAGARHAEAAIGDVSPLDPVTTEITLPDGWDDWDAWVTTRDRAHTSARQRQADSATDIAHGLVPVPEGLEIPPGLAKEPRDLELPAWLKGRYGAAVGRAVHATLQTVDLTTGEGLAGIAEAQALAEGVADRLEAVQALARAGWAAPSVRAAASREHHKETYVGTVVGGQLVEGYIDLLYRDDDGSLVVIDYKTDAEPDPDTVRAYQAQLAVYARALADATGDTVSRCALVFCREDGAVERDVPLGA